MSQVQHAQSIQPLDKLFILTEIDSQNWIATRVTHNLEQSGLTTQVELEVTE